MFRPSCRAVCSCPQPGCVPACWFTRFSLVPGAFLVWQITGRLLSKLGLGCLRLLHLKPAAVYVLSTSQAVLQAAASDKCSLRTLFINLLFGPGLIQWDWIGSTLGRPKSFLGIRSILLTLGGFAETYNCENIKCRVWGLRKQTYGYQRGRAGNNWKSRFCIYTTIFRMGLPW